jgi:hypothetical protein
MRRTTMSESEYTWNYRLVNMPSSNLGEDYFVLCEVHYEGGSMTGYTPVDRVTSHTLKGMKQELKWMAMALKEPVLHEDDPQVGRWDFQRGELA